MKNKRGRPRKQAMTNEIRTTEVDVKTVVPEYTSRESIEPAPITEKNPDYHNGCPACGAKVLVTMAKHVDYRYCRCRECGWQGKMRR